MASFTHILFMSVLDGIGSKTSLHSVQKSLIFMLLAVFFVTNAYSQSDELNTKPTIAILPFQYSSNVSRADADALSQKVESAFIKSKRFVVIERTNFEQIFKELESQKNEVYLNSTKLAQQGELIGATQLVVGTVSSAGNSGTTFSFKVVDVSTGETKDSKSISDYSNRKAAGIFGKTLDVVTGGKTSIYTSESTMNVVGGATLNIDKNVMDFINGNYPLTFSLVEITKFKGEDAIEVMIAGGKSEGLSSSISLEVINETTKTIGTKQLRRKTSIGKLKVEKVEGDLTICKVTNGGKEIKEFFNPSNKVYASTINK
jgi:TolB-like protein